MLLLDILPGKIGFCIVRHTPSETTNKCGLQLELNYWVIFMTAKQSSVTPGVLEIEIQISGASKKSKEHLKVILDKVNWVWFTLIEPNLSGP